MTSPIVWSPSPEQIATSNLTRFMAGLPASTETYEDLWRWSIDERGDFWQAAWDFTGVIASRPPDRPVGEEAMPGTEWFPGARLNYAENLLKGDPGAVAVVAVAEEGGFETIDRSELRRRVAAAQQGLRGLGVEAGDRVAALITNGTEAVVAMLATAAIGAIWSSCSPDFGPLGVIDRFGQIEPKVLIAVDGYRYNGNTHRVGQTVTEALASIDSIEHLVMIDRIGDPPPPAAVRWDDLLARGPDEPDYAQLPFDHPLFIMFSSGTTGRPKSIVHGAGGTLLKHLTEHVLHCDLRTGDRLFWFTTCGWMMWNWLVSGLAAGAAIVLYDGSPSHPSLERLWQLAEQTGITHFGTSPKFLAANANAGLVPRDVADLSSVRWVGSTGAPLLPEQFDWFYVNLPPAVQLASVSGGTDIIGCFAIGVPILPVRRGELQARALGMAVEAWGPDGEPVVGRKGELVCTRPFVSMPVGFWKDDDGGRYHDAYFAEFEGVWTHGDFIEVRPEGGVVIYGRSDTTLNPGGVRIGTAEIYRAIEPMDEIVDAIAVGREAGGDVEVMLFVVLADGVELDDRLRDQIADRIRAMTSPRHVPRRIAQVSDIPYTISGKKVEKAVRLVLAGEPVTNRDALMNPAALDAFKEIREQELG
ncbi:MAG TPA: acetoacetate--CoA ligase [Acidimicrobiia bacterium]|nr:acetoacetate--CoA ligase [Acidimicrobiia bacterium]